jgi:hypothetical protein
MPRLTEITPLGRSPRLTPPASMSEPARKVFLDLVLGAKADHFQVTDLPLLVRYCEAIATAERAEGEVAREPLIDDRASPWVGILGQANKTVQGLSMRLRLSPQARAVNNPSRPQPQVSYYDRMALERQAQDEDSAQ